MPSEGANGTAPQGQTELEQVTAQLADMTALKHTLERMLSVLVSTLGGQAAIPLAVVQNGYPFATDFTVVPIEQAGVVVLSVLAFDDNGVQRPVKIEPVAPVGNLPLVRGEKRTRGGLILRS